MDEFRVWILGLNDFPARWFCGSWTKFHGWVHIISDVLVWAAYLTIPVLLIYFISKRKDMPFPKILWLFALFIFACGTGHLLEAIIYWVPIYRIAGINKVLTAVVSWATVFALIPIIPFALSLKSPKELQAEVDKRAEVEKELRIIATELEKNNKELKERQVALEKNSIELDRMNKAMTGRENRMIELKERIKQLEEQIDEKA